MRSRLERLACDFDISENYFAWQAFGRGYDKEDRRAVPRYLQQEHYEGLRSRLDRVSVEHESMTEYLRAQPDASMDRYILLDAQDWMTPAILTELWGEILRTARPGARVIFRPPGKRRFFPDGSTTTSLSAGITGKRNPSPGRPGTALRSMAGSTSTF